jgi:HSP20 family protein
MRRIMPFGEVRMPSVDLEDQGKEYRLTVDLPGFSKEDVDVQVMEDGVTVHAKKMQSTDEQNKNYIRRERAARTYFRRIMLPEPVRADEAKASLTNGTLEIKLPKKEPKETKKLTIT